MSNYNSESVIKNAINFLQTGKLPVNILRMTKYRFRNRFNTKNYSISSRNLHIRVRKWYQKTLFLKF
jgi:hypothetical protein